MKLSYALGSTDVPLLAETIGENLEHTTARFPDRDALIVRHQGIRCTYREFDEATDRLAKAFLRLGVELGGEPRLPHIRTRIRAESIRMPILDLGSFISDV